MSLSITNSLRKLLSTPIIYSTFQEAIGASSSRRKFVDVYMKPNVGDQVLDIGCGPGDILPFLPKVKYIGFDMSKSYIDAAISKYGDHGEFIHQALDETNVQNFATNDIVLAIGVLHHLNDSEVCNLFKIAFTALKDGGRLITFDGVYLDNQSPIARYLLDNDRGQYVRTAVEYERLAKSVFPGVTSYIRRNLLRIPYDHIILECTR